MRVLRNCGITQKTSGWVSVCGNFRIKRSESDIFVAIIII